jgi:hypothetical protein
MALTIGDSTTREERLRWAPDEAIALVRTTAPTEIATVWTAMNDQLQAAGVPREALEMAVMYWSQALDGLDPGPVPPARLAQLDKMQAINHRGLPALERWMAALRAQVTRAEDLDWVIQFLMQARQAWLLVENLKGRAR